MINAPPTSTPDQLCAVMLPHFTCSREEGFTTSMGALDTCTFMRGDC